MGHFCNVSVSYLFPQKVQWAAQMGEQKDFLDQQSGGTETKHHLLDRTATLYSWSLQQLWLPAQGLYKTKPIYIGANQSAGWGEPIAVPSCYWGNVRFLWGVAVGMLPAPLDSPYPWAAQIRHDVFYLYFFKMEGMGRSWNTREG